MGLGAAEQDQHDLRVGDHKMEENMHSPNPKMLPCLIDHLNQIGPPDLHSDIARGHAIRCLPS